jgi:hypothetical protein
MSGGGLTRGRGGAGVLRHLIFVIRILGVWNSAFWSYLDPGVLLILEVKSLQRKKTVG